MRLPRRVHILGALLAAATLSCGHRILHHKEGEPRASFGLQLAQEDPQGPLVSKSGARFRTIGEPVVTEADIERVASDPLRGGGCDIEITFTPAAAERLATFTADKAGQTLAILIDEEAVATPRLSGPLTPTVQITAGWSCDEAGSIASSIAP